MGAQKVKASASGTRSPWAPPLASDRCSVPRHVGSVRRAFVSATPCAPPIAPGPAQLRNCTRPSRALIDPRSSWYSRAPTVSSCACSPGYASPTSCNPLCTGCPAPPVTNVSTSLGHSRMVQKLVRSLLRQTLEPEGAPIVVVNPLLVLFLGRGDLRPTTVFVSNWPRSWSGTPPPHRGFATRRCNRQSHNWKQS